jgi:hypothetical protein
MGGWVLGLDRHRGRVADHMARSIPRHAPGRHHRLVLVLHCVVVLVRHLLVLLLLLRGQRHVVLVLLLVMLPLPRARRAVLVNLPF